MRFSFCELPLVICEGDILYTLAVTTGFEHGIPLNIGLHHDGTAVDCDLTVGMLYFLPLPPEVTRYLISFVAILDL